MNGNNDIEVQNRLLALIRQHDFEIQPMDIFSEIMGIAGNTDPDNMVVTFNESQDDATETVAHELVHVVLRHGRGSPEDEDHALGEVEASLASVALVKQLVGREPEGFSYITSEGSPLAGNPDLPAIVAKAQPRADWAVNEIMRELGQPGSWQTHLLRRVGHAVFCAVSWWGNGSGTVPRGLYHPPEIVDGMVPHNVNDPDWMVGSGVGEWQYPSEEHKLLEDRLLGRSGRSARLPDSPRAGFHYVAEHDYLTRWPYYRLVADDPIVKAIDDQLILAEWMRTERKRRQVNAESIPDPFPHGSHTVLPSDHPAR